MLFLAVGKLGMSYDQIMRYKSLLSVDFILIDGRVDSHVLQTVINQSIMALNDHLACHIVVLCATRKRAEEIDLLGEQCGHELFFHGENVDATEEVQGLLSASKLLVVPTASYNPVLSTFKEYRSDAPLLLVSPGSSHFCSNGASSESFVEMSPLDCFVSLLK